MNNHWINDIEEKRPIITDIQNMAETLGSPRIAYAFLVTFNLEELRGIQKSMTAKYNREVKKNKQ